MKPQQPQFDPFTALVVDDEPLARAHLARLLNDAGVGEVIQARDAVECLHLLDSEPEPPDWAFIDVQMPNMNGLALADALNAGHVSSVVNAGSPSIVFVTGYEEYAIQAFERAAVDYLLKPVERERLSLTLQRLAATAATAADRSRSSVALPVPALERLPVKLDYAVRLLDLADIMAANARERRVDIFTRDEVYPTYYSLGQLEGRLPGDRFVRVHDSWIVSLAELLEIHNLGNQTYQARLRFDGRLIPIGRRRLPHLKALFGL